MRSFPSTAALPTSDEVLGGLFDELARRIEAGERIDDQQLARDYPEHAAQLERLLPTLLALADLGHLDAIGPAVPPGNDNASRDRPDQPLDGGPLAAGTAAPMRGILGDFRILRELGRGGMGIVYEAEQLSLGRRVALKVLPFAVVLGEMQLKRFKNEARAAALLDHPNIVSIYSVGCERSVHFYAMQLIEGQSLAELISGIRGQETEARGQRSEVRGERSEDRGQRSEVGGQKSEVASASGQPPTANSQQPPQSEIRNLKSEIETQAIAAFSTEFSTNPKRYFCRVAELGIQAADALEHAHQQGVLHRDIKPANLLLDGSGKLFVTDFGLARLEADASMTASGDLLGTLRYMSPEQASGSRMGVDHRTDVYSLGVTLYELATGVPAFAGQDRSDLLRRIADEDPRPPRQLRPDLPHDLETIILKAVEKVPGDRYASAAEVADDLRRYLGDQPIQAARPTMAHRCRKWARRHQALAWATAVTLLVTTVLLAGSTAVVLGAYRAERIQRNAREWEYQRAEEQRRIAVKASKREQVARSDAERQRDRAADSLYLAHMRLAQRDWESGQTERLFSTLEQHLPAPGKPDPRRWEWYYLLSRCYGCTRMLRDDDSVNSVAWQPGGRTVAYGGHHGTFLWDPLEVHEPVRISAECSARVAWSPDGKRLAVAGHCIQSISVWDAQTRTRLAEMYALGARATDLVWSPDGKKLASSSNERGVDLWDVDAGQHLRQIHCEEEESSAVAWHPDMHFLAVGTLLRDVGNAVNAVKVYDLRTGEVAVTVESPRYEVLDLAWDPTGSRLATSHYPESVFLWSFDGEELIELASFAHPSGVDEMAWDSSGRYLATASRGQQVAVWDTEAQARYRTFHGHLGSVRSVSWSSDDKYLISGGQSDRTIRVWDVHNDPESIARVGGTQHGSIQLSPDGSRMLLPVDTGWRIITLSGETQLVVDLPHSRGSNCAWRPDGRALALVTTRGLVVVDSRTGEELYVLDAPQNVWGIAWSSDAKWLAAGSYEGKKVTIWSTQDRAESHVIEVPEKATGVAFHPDGIEIAVGTDAGNVSLWSVGDWKQVGVLRGHRSWIGQIAWSSDGKTIATAGYDGVIRLWDASSRQELDVLAGHSSHISALAWSPDGQRIATGSADGTLRLWGAAKGDELLSFEEGLGEVFVQWSPDGNRVMSRCSGQVKIRDASVGYAAADGVEFARDLALLGCQRAVAVANSGRTREAEGLFRELLGHTSVMLGEEHPMALESMYNLAVQVINQDRYSEAQTLFRDTLELQERVFGAEHYRTLRTMGDLAYVYQRQNEVEDAVRLHRELVEAVRDLNDNDPTKFTSYLYLLDLLAEQGHFADAYAAGGELLDLCRGTDRLGDSLTTYSLNQFFAACEAVGKHAEAKEVWEEMRSQAEWKSGDEDLPEADFAEYRIRLDTPGEYQLYVRYGGHDGESDSLWGCVLGEGNEVLAGYLFEGADAGPDMGDADADFATHSWETFGRRRGWNGPLTLKQPALFDVPKAGEYVIRLMVREGGVAADAMILQRANLPAPKHDGPAESPRDDSGAFLMQDGIVTIEAEHFSSAFPTWRVVPGDEGGEVRHKNFRGSGYLLTPE